MLKYSPHSLTTCYLRLVLSETNTVLATATGFFYEHNNYVYLITNGHNVTGVHPETKERISNHSGFPDCIHIKPRFELKTNQISEWYQPLLINLYEDNQLTKPCWFIHPKYGYKVDVVAIPFIPKDKVHQKMILKCINNFDFDDVLLEVGDDVFILGYPLDILQIIEFPIWKRGSVATEPGFDFNKLPQILVDTATRPGMSGSPVIVSKAGVHLLRENGEPRDESFFGTSQGFVGVYSGRLGQDRFNAQLGIVWKKKVIDEILEAKIKSDAEFQKV